MRILEGEQDWLPAGEILEVIDLRLRLNLRAAPNGRASRIIVAHAADGGVSGLLVDGVSEVLSVAVDALRSVTAAETGNVETLCVRDDRFISVIDEFYDRGVNVVISAAAAPPELYKGEKLKFEFQRTSSRLIEMQSEEYLARAHRAA